MRRQGGAGTIAALLLCCVFGVTALMALTAGAGIYRQVAQRVEQSGERRVGLTYLAAKVRSFDQEGAVLTGTFGDGDALYLLQDIGGLTYETILYVHDGWLKELLLRACDDMKELARTVLKESEKLYGANDDMTVVTVRVEERL